MLRNSVNINVALFGDDTSTVFKLDLTKDCYTLVDVALGAPVINWNGSYPLLGVSSSDPARYSVTNMGSILTITFSTPPPSGNPTSASIYLMLQSSQNQQ